jgi:hypothetical protein
MAKTQKYPFAKGDIVAMKTTGRKGVAMSVGQFGHQIAALVCWFDKDGHDFIEVGKLKKTLRGIDGGRDPDT